MRRAGRSCTGPSTRSRRPSGGFDAGKVPSGSEPGRELVRRRPLWRPVPAGGRRGAPLRVQPLCAAGRPEARARRQAGRGPRRDQEAGGRPRPADRDVQAGLSAGRSRAPARRRPRRPTANAGISARDTAAAASANAIVKPASSGTSEPAGVWAEITAAVTWAPTAAPTVRMIRFTPLATPVSLADECSMTSEPMAASANARPTPSRPSQTSASAGRRVREREQEQRERGRGQPDPQRHSVAEPRAEPARRRAADDHRDGRGDEVQAGLGQRRAVAVRRHLHERRHQHEERRQREADEHRGGVRQRHRRLGEGAEVDQRLRHAALDRDPRGEGAHGGGEERHDRQRGPAPRLALRDREEEGDEGKANTAAPRKSGRPPRRTGDSGTVSRDQRRRPAPGHAAEHEQPLPAQVVEHEAAADQADPAAQAERARRERRSRRRSARAGTRRG